MDLSLLALVWFIASLSLLILLPLVHMPVWWVVQLCGLRHGVGAALAGAMSMVTIPFVLAVVLPHSSSSAVGGPQYDEVMSVAALALSGALIGFVIWRASEWNIDAR